MPIQDGTEMGMSLDDLVVKLRAAAYYAPLFQSAFGTPEITSDRIARALAQFVRSLVSAGSRYDQAYTVTAGGGGVVTASFATTLTAQEQSGEALFRTVGCASCHATVAHVSDGVHNIGLDATNPDVGAGDGAFKAPSLRNVAVRPRYMHDGRFTTLEQVVDFFDAGVQPNPSLDARLRAPDGSPRRLGLTAAQRATLVAYLRALTDSAFLTARRFSNPFATAATTPTTGGTTGGGTAAPPPPPSGATVTIQGNAYHLASITVRPGTTITFTNLDNARHSAGFTSASIVSTPIFRSGSEAVVMPTAAGTYGYQCAVHGAAMRGTVVVQ
jgi:cytochrome c peroxidase/plastocyanin